MATRSPPGGARRCRPNQQRVQTTRASRELAERRLEAEQRKFAAGTSTNFLVFQAQRDLAVGPEQRAARHPRLRPIQSTWIDLRRPVQEGRRLQVTQFAAMRRVRIRVCRSRSPSSRSTRPRHIAAAIDSAAWADEVLVVDSGSTDDTVAIARGKGVRVMSRDVARLGRSEELRRVRRGARLDLLARRRRARHAGARG